MYWRNLFIQTVKNIFIRFPKRVIGFFHYWGEFFQFRKMNGKRGPVKISDSFPCLKDRLISTPFDQHYTYHPAWAARILAKTKPIEHIDISSILHFGTLVSAFIPVKFYDYRPSGITLTGYQNEFADLKNLPFENDSVASLSCMHTVEHIGLGRYGDELDADGDRKAIEEMKRVLKPGGDLLFVTPVGKERIMFNAHRVYSYDQIMDFFSPLKLEQFSLIPDAGGLIENADPHLVESQDYGCGCFWFKK